MRLSLISLLMIPLTVGCGSGDKEGEAGAGADTGTGGGGGDNPDGGNNGTDDTISFVECKGATPSLVVEGYSPTQVELDSRQSVRVTTYENQTTFEKRSEVLEVCDLTEQCDWNEPDRECFSCGEIGDAQFSFAVDELTLEQAGCAATVQPLFDGTCDSFRFRQGATFDVDDDVLSYNVSFEYNEGSDDQRAKLVLTTDSDEEFSAHKDAAGSPGDISEGWDLTWSYTLVEMPTTGEGLLKVELSAEGTYTLASGVSQTFDISGRFVQENCGGE